MLLAVSLLILCLMLAGCGKAAQELPAPTQATPAAEATPTEEPAPTEQPAPVTEPTVALPEEEPTVQPTEPEPVPAEAAETAPVEAEAEPAADPEPAAEEYVSPFPGTWKPYSQEGSIPITHEQLVEMGYADNMSLTINADGSMSTSFFGTTSRESWTDNGDGSGTATISGETYPMTIRNGMLAMDMGNYVAYYENAENPSGNVSAPAPVPAGNDQVTLPSKADAPTLPYTLSNGLTIDELSVVLAGGRMWSFGYALQNPTGTVQSFDPSGFVLRNADGTAVSTYASFVSADEVKPGVPLRTSVSIGMKDALNPGDEIYFFYDGVFLGTAVAKEF